MTSRRYVPVRATLALTGVPAPAADPLVSMSALAPGERGGIHAYEFDTN
jgi:hypothetical protein